MSTSEKSIPEKAVETERSARFPFQYAVLMVAVPGVMLLLGFLLGTGPVVAALLAVVAFAAVFAGVGSLMRRRALDRPPGRHPVRPPSA